MFRFILFFSIITALLMSCTPTLDDKNVNFAFMNKTSYKGFIGESDTLVMAEVEYNAIIERNGVELRDSTYRELALFHGDSVWVHLNNFGADTTYAVVLRNSDSAVVSLMSEFDGEIDTSFYVCRFIKDSTFVTYKDTVNTYDGEPIPGTTFKDSLGIDHIEGLNSANDYYKIYRDWREDIIRSY